MPSDRPLFGTTNASVLLDALRGLAALLVLLDHWRAAFFVDFPKVIQHRASVGPLYVISGAGHQAVVIFFVLSGYLISGSILRSIGRGEWSWRRYLVHRLVRLWLVLIPALFLGGILDEAGLSIGHAPGLYAGMSGNHMTGNVIHALRPAVLLGNAAFLQTILVPAFGSNGALWSLANEWWYYILFPLAACVLARVYRKPIEIASCLLAFVAFSVFVGKAILILFPAWLLGVLLYVIPKAQRPFNSHLMAVASVFYGVLYFGCSVLSHLGHVGKLRVSEIATDNLLAIGTFCFIWLLLSQTQRADESIGVRAARGTARFSYTLYVTHLPFLILCASLIVHDSRWMPTLPHMLISSVVLAGALAYAWFVAYATEFRVDEVRSWVEARLGVGKKDPARA